MKTKVFIDGSEGTTGLRINERFENRDDIELLQIDSSLRKDTDERKRLINESDITFLCLPDQASIEAVALAEDHVRIIDASTAHRTNPEWAYGFPELSGEMERKIAEGKRVAVPGCHASGFMSIVYPLVKEKIASADYPFSAFSLTGYSGGGKKMIAEYEGDERATDLDAPREYALSQEHKHLKEMKEIAGLKRLPLFSPIVADYYSGMLVTVPFYASMLNGKQTPESVHQFFTEYYANKKFIQVMPIGTEAESRGFLSGISCTGWDGMKLYITGNEDRILVSSHFDNLGKGASGAAIECFNIMTGCAQDQGLHL